MEAKGRSLVSVIRRVCEWVGIPLAGFFSTAPTYTPYGEGGGVAQWPNGGRVVENNHVNFLTSESVRTKITLLYINNLWWEICIDLGLAGKLTVEVLFVATFYFSWIWGVEIGDCVIGTDWNAICRWIKFINPLSVKKKNRYEKRAWRVREWIPRSVYRPYS